MLTGVLNQLESHLNRLVENDPKLALTWDRECLLRSKLVHHLMGDRKTVGVCQGVGTDGALLLQTDAGLVRLVGGTITHWE